MDHLKDLSCLIVLKQVQKLIEVESNGLFYLGSNDTVPPLFYLLHYDRLHKIISIQHFQVPSRDCMAIDPAKRVWIKISDLINLKRCYTCRDKENERQSVVYNYTLTAHRLFGKKNELKNSKWIS